MVHTRVLLVSSLVCVVSMLDRVSGVDITIHDDWCGGSTSADLARNRVLDDWDGWHYESTSTFTFVPTRPGWYVFSTCEVGTWEMQVLARSSDDNYGYIDSDVVDEDSCGPEGEGFIRRIYFHNTTAKLRFVAGAYRNVKSIQLGLVCPEPASCNSGVSTTLAGSYTLKPPYTGEYTVHDCASNIDTWLHVMLERDVEQLMLVDEAKLIAQNLGLRLGGCGAAFEDGKRVGGLYAYKGGQCDGIAFFGRGTNAEEQNAIIPYEHSEFGTPYRPHMVTNVVDANNCGGDTTGQSENITLTSVQVLHVLVTPNLDDAPMDERATATITTTFTCPSPTYAPTSSTASPSSKPTAFPTTDPPTVSPTISPTLFPTTTSPTPSPSSSKPTSSPITSTPTVSPTVSPTLTPTTTSPTASPSSSTPTAFPTTNPPTVSPTVSPTKTLPTASPSSSMPTSFPTSSVPTGTPTMFPTLIPTTFPTSSPTTSPSTSSPTMLPTSAPTSSTTLSPSASPAVQLASTERDEEEDMWIGVIVAVLLISCCLIICIVWGVRQYFRKKGHRAAISDGNHSGIPHFRFKSGKRVSTPASPPQTYHNMVFNSTLAPNTLEGDVIFDANPTSSNRNDHDECVYDATALTKSSDTNAQQMYSQPSKKKTDYSNDNQQIYSQPSKKKTNTTSDNQQMYSQPSKKKTDSSEAIYAQPSKKKANASSDGVYSQPRTKKILFNVSTHQDDVMYVTNPNTGGGNINGDVVYDANPLAGFDGFDGDNVDTDDQQIYSQPSKKKTNSDSDNQQIYSQPSKKKTNTRSDGRQIYSQPSNKKNASNEDEKSFTTDDHTEENEGFGNLSGSTNANYSADYDTNNNNDANSYAVLHPSMVNSDDPLHQQYSALDPGKRIEDLNFAISDETDALIHPGLDRVSAETTLRKAVVGDGTVIGYLVRTKGKTMLVMSILLSASKFIHEIVKIHKNGDYEIIDISGPTLSVVAGQVAERLKTKFNAKQITPVLIQRPQILEYQYFDEPEANC